jgi:DNA-binding IclR family transcriptional regulator
MVFNAPRDYRFFLPVPAGKSFTVKGLAEAAGIAPETAGKALYVLSRIGLAERAGKAGNAYVYRRREV